MQESTFKIPNLKSEKFSFRLGRRATSSGFGGRSTAVPTVGPTASLAVSSADETPACPTDKMSVPRGVNENHCDR
jgi:hypothetical protein